MPSGLIHYWTGQWTLIGNEHGSIKWRNQKTVKIPPEFYDDNPKSVCLCVYPTGARYNKGTITITVIDSYSLSIFKTVVIQEIPVENANFNSPVIIRFSYRKGKYVYGSELYLSLFYVLILPSLYSNFCWFQNLH